MKKIIIILILFLPAMATQAQKDKILTQKGNEALKDGNLEEAREAYHKALKVNPDYLEAQFNLGNSYMLESRGILESVENAPDENQKKAIYEKAREVSKKAAAEYAKVAGDLKDPERINKVQYNLGNSQLISGDIDKSIEAYKEALRNNPADEDARYNLAYAQHMKKQQQQQQQQQQQDQKQDQEKKDDQKPDENKDNKDQKKDENKEQQDQRKDELSKEDAEKMLEALTKQEKDLQDKLNKKKVKAQPLKIEKNW